MTKQTLIVHNVENAFFSVVHIRGGPSLTPSPLTNWGCKRKVPKFTLRWKPGWRNRRRQRHRGRPSRPGERLEPFEVAPGSADQRRPRDAPIRETRHRQGRTETGHVRSRFCRRAGEVPAGIVTLVLYPFKCFFELTRLPSKAPNLTSFVASGHHRDTRTPSHRPLENF